MFCSASLLHSKTWYDLSMGEIRDMVDPPEEEELLILRDPPDQKSALIGREGERLKPFIM